MSGTRKINFLMPKNRKFRLQMHHKCYLSNFKCNFSNQGSESESNLKFSVEGKVDWSKNKKLALNSGIQTNQILKNDDEVCIPHLFSILWL